jgi:hypothetical protein
MALSIKTEEADRLARELARLTGESITEAVTVALRERCDRERRDFGRQSRSDLSCLSSWRASGVITTNVP